jgi:hypothetical protein
VGVVSVDDEVEVWDMRDMGLGSYRLVGAGRGCGSSG